MPHIRLGRVCLGRVCLGRDHGDGQPDSSPMLSLVPRECARPPCINAVNKRPIPLGFLTPWMCGAKNTDVNGWSRIDRIRFINRGRRWTSTAFHTPTHFHRGRPVAVLLAALLSVL